MSHTPGPWKVSMAIFDGEDGEVGYVLEGVKEASSDDAALIAAAPDMLAMLEELQECAYYWSEYDVPLGIVDRLDEVIKKARDTE